MSDLTARIASELAYTEQAIINQVVPHDCPQCYYYACPDSGMHGSNGQMNAAGAKCKCRCGKARTHLMDRFNLLQEIAEALGGLPDAPPTE